MVISVDTAWDEEGNEEGGVAQYEESDEENEVEGFTASDLGLPLEELEALFGLNDPVKWSNVEPGIPSILPE